MASLHPLQQLSRLEEEIDSGSGYTGTSRWMIPYADLLTLLLGFFIVLFGIIATQQKEDAAKMAQTQQAISALETQKQQAQGELAELEKTIASKQKDVASLVKIARLGQYATPEQSTLAMEQLEETLVKALNIQGQQVTVSQDQRGLVISFQERIFFGPGEAKLSDSAQNTLDKLATVLSSIAQPIRVEGHTDNTPIQTATYPSNWELSTARATMIVRNLIEKHHFLPERLSAAGYGEFYPLAENSSIEGKQKNRRVDIVILNPWVQSAAKKPQEPPTVFEE